MCIVPKAVIDEVQAYPTLKNLKEMHAAFVGVLENFGGFEEFLFSTWPLSLIFPGKERTCVGLGSELQAAFKKAKYSEVS